VIQLEDPAELKVEIARLERMLSAVLDRAPRGAEPVASGHDGAAGRG